MEIEKEVLDKLLANDQKPEDIVGENGLLKHPSFADPEHGQEFRPLVLQQYSPV
jgi:hypothetical protein